MILAEILADLRDVRIAAAKLGVAPSDVVQRILPEVVAYDAGQVHKDERAYRTVRRASELARALT